MVKTIIVLFSCIYAIMHIEVRLFGHFFIYIYIKWQNSPYIAQKNWSLRVLNLCIVWMWLYVWEWIVVLFIGCFWWPFVKLQRWPCGGYCDPGLVVPCCALESGSNKKCFIIDIRYRGKSKYDILTKLNVVNFVRWLNSECFLIIPLGEYSVYIYIMHKIVCPQ